MIASMSYQELKDFEKKILEDGDKLDTLSQSEKRLLEMNAILVRFRLDNFRKKI